MKTIAFLNVRRAVGKTTLVASIAADLFRRGKKVLMVDLDAQSTLTTSFIDPVRIVRSPTIFDVLTDKVEDLPIRHVRSNEHAEGCLDLVPSGYEMFKLPQELPHRYFQETALLKKLNPIAANYDYILLDCPPEFSIVTNMAVAAADGFLVPFKPESLAFSALSMTTAYINEFSALRRLSESPIIGYILTFWEGAKADKDLAEAVGLVYAPKLFQAKIVNSTHIPSAAWSKRTIFEDSPNSKAAACYEATTTELLERLQPNSQS